MNNLVVSQRDIGRQCEEQVASICSMLGYSVYIPEKQSCTPWDIEVNGMRVQVKARDGVYRRDRIKLRTNRCNTEIAYLCSDVDFFVIRFLPIWFVIPSFAIANQAGEVRNAIYPAKLGEWTNRWDAIKGDRVLYSRQKCFEF